MSNMLELDTKICKKNNTNLTFIMGIVLTCAGGSDIFTVHLVDIFLKNHWNICAIRLCLINKLAINIIKTNKNKNYFVSYFLKNVLK